VEEEQVPSHSAAKRDFYGRGRRRHYSRHYARGGRLRLRCMSYKEGATSHGGAVESSRRRSVLFISDSAYEMC
jgi:hypothetical protein